MARTVGSLMAIISASMLARKPQNSTTFIQPNSHQPEANISDALWLHIILMTTASLFLFPVFIIFKRRNYLWFIVEVITTMMIGLGTVTGYSQRSRFQSSSHGALGYFIIFLLAGCLFVDAWRSRIYTPPFKFVNRAFDVFQLATCIGVPLFLFVEVVIGVIAVLGFCSYPYTQQCFGHLGIGSVYLIYFSFWAVLVHDNRMFSQMRLRSEVLDAVLFVPCGLGLSFFGHAWGYPWDDESLQHVCLGIFAFIAAILGVWLSTDSNGLPRRNIFPGLVSLAAGYTFLSHPAKPNHILSALHQAIGFLTAGIGICRILDVVFVTYLAPVPTSRLREGCDSKRNKKSGIGLKGPWNALASFLGITVGIIAMVANEEQAKVLEDWGLPESSVFMVLLAMGMGVMGYVSILAVLVSGSKNSEEGGEYERIEMIEDS